MPTSATLLALVLAATTARAQPPAEALANLVDLPDMTSRRAAALDLARRSDVSLEQWRQAMAAFGDGTFTRREPGLQRHVVSLHVAGQVEATELFLFVPASYDPSQPSPLLLMAHGTGGSGRGLHAMWQETAERLRMLVLCPSEAGANEGYRFSKREREAAFAAIRWVRRLCNIDENRVFVAGISRGGHLAWDLALRFPDRLAAIAPMIGAPRLSTVEGQNNTRYLENVVRLPIRHLQGTQDDPMLVWSVREAFRTLRELHALDAELLEFPELGHSFRFDAVDWIAFFGKAVRQPRPAVVVRRAAAPGEGRASWAEVLQTGGDVAETFRMRVKEQEWQAMDDDAKRRFLAAQALERTARLQVKMLAPGRFDAEGDGVRRFRLLLEEDMFTPGQPVEVTFAGKRRRLQGKPSKQVLLLEFAERFDRTFLPVAEVVVSG